MNIFNLPDLGEGLQDAEIVAWHVTEGDYVISDQPLVSVETDKAVVEIPAPYSGTIKRLIAETGDIVPVGGALAEISTERDKDTGAIVGDIGPKAEQAHPAGSRPPAPPGSPTVQAAPAVRRLAHERAVDLAGVAGSGPGGAILSSDVLAAASGTVPGEELRGARRAMARTMTMSHASVVAATVMDHALIDGWSVNEDPTLRLVHAVVAACKAEPALNAWFDGKRRQLHDHVDLALAMDTPDGLFTPVLRHVGTDDVAGQLSVLKAAVRDRSIQREAMKGATITLSNFGMIGGAYAALVVTPPQVAILGAGRISVQMTVVDDHPGPSRILPLSLSFDHRVVTGGEAARFLNAVKENLERENIDEEKGSS
ncbi:dihydrolipoamide acetyltransferase family protein [Marimonas arenosa]|uniref:Dihydrolipoamide acetyltransferase component of pyruvate dehydrogenase complex n=1 Tax=Marimonas arenosa TaxID=1795305 RepID=A0AAE4B4C5_9RHOB|nr:dihydrolipoamide acetyltransferase family protein [Marimonas arenosa]MDQ2090082.1 2-oxo acid dehydrogenase subunit E2 [Marimonas arenosa]